MDKKMYDYWLYGLESIGRKTFLKLQEKGLDGETLYHCKENEIPDFLSGRQKQSLLKGKTKTKDGLLKEYESLKKDGISMSVFGENEYPKRLYEIPDAPAVLFYKGKLPKETERAVAIIGARNCSGYGKAVAEKFAAFFAEQNVNVISGMALGVDGFAQKAALKAGGFSIGVLGSGVEVCYPGENESLYRDLIQKGCVLSEFLPYIKASANFFPQRNRIISGLSDALIVIEAKEKSGTMITVEMALEQGKEVFVVPGRITDDLSKGCNKLLWEGANIAVSPENVFESLYGEWHRNIFENGQEDNSLLQKQILSFLDVTPLHINVLQEKMEDIPFDVLMRELLYLMLEDKVIQAGSQLYQKKGI